MESNDNDNSEKTLSDFEKIMQLNKLGALFLSGDKYDKALNILSKTLEFYIEKKQNKKIPPFFYSILYCNLAKTYSCLKQFDKASPLYSECILNHPLFKLLLKHNAFLTQTFHLMPLEQLLTCKNSVTEEKVLLKFNALNSYFSITDTTIRNEVVKRIHKEFKGNNLNTIASLSDSLVNLAVILQINNKELEASLDMYIISLLLTQDNTVANVNYNNFLREVNMKLKSDEYIVKRIQYAKNDNTITITPADAAVPLSTIETTTTTTTHVNEVSMNFICMKWGTKYSSEYVNKLYRGIHTNTQHKFNFYCITDDNTGLDVAIKPIKLETQFTGWMKKSMLFDDKILNQITTNAHSVLCFIDLDMIIYNNIDFLFDYNGNFCLMKTDDIQCESSINGYNSSIVIWKRGFGKEIYNVMERYETLLTKQIVRFDHYLEFIIKHSDFIQDVFKGKILDYNTYCKGKDELPSTGAIIAFPRSPKPHECNESWISKYWK